MNAVAFMSRGFSRHGAECACNYCASPVAPAPASPVFCVCGNRLADCDGSRTGCANYVPPLRCRECDAELTTGDEERNERCSPCYRHVYGETYGGRP